MHPRPLWTGEVLEGKALAALDADEKLAAHVFARAGLDFLQGVDQIWNIADLAIPTRVERSPEGYWRALLAGHEAPAPLTVVYAASISGELIFSLGPGAFPRWKRRALMEAGILGVPLVSLAPLPSEASDSTQVLWEAIELLIRVRVLGGERARDALPLSRPFLCRWTPLSERATRSGMESLERWELIRRVGTYTKSGGRRPLTLWTVEVVA